MFTKILGVHGCLIKSFHRNQNLLSLLIRYKNKALLIGALTGSRIMTASQTYRSMRIPSHQQQIFATVATWGNLYKRFGKATVEARRERIEQAFRKLEAQLQIKGV